MKTKTTVATAHLTVKKITIQPFISTMLTIYKTSPSKQVLDMKTTNPLVHTPAGKQAYAMT
jgi:hypothetical protein